MSTTTKKANRALVELMVEAEMARVDVLRANDEVEQQDAKLREAMAAMEREKDALYHRCDRLMRAQIELDEIYQKAANAGVDSTVFRRLVDEAAETLAASGLLAMQEATDTSSVATPKAVDAPPSRRGRPRGSRATANSNAAASQPNQTEADVPAQDGAAHSNPTQDISARESDMVASDTSAATTNPTGVSSLEVTAKSELVDTGAEAALTQEDLKVAEDERYRHLLWGDAEDAVDDNGLLDAANPSDGAETGSVIANTATETTLRNGEPATSEAVATGPRPSEKAPAKAPLPAFVRRSPFGR